MIGFLIFTFALVLALLGGLMALSFWLARRWLSREGRGNPAVLQMLRWFWTMALVGGSAVILWHWQINPLPSDEELIAYFHAHRADFEELARRHREHIYDKNTYVESWFQVGDTPEIARRAGVKWVELKGPVMLPNSYSIEAAKRYADISQQKGPLFWELQSRRFLEFSLSDPRYFHSVTLRYSALYKRLTYTAEPVLIENGRFLHPPSHGSSMQGGHPALASLNGHPAEFKDNYCLVRRIESQWFIFMCRNMGGGKS